MVDNEEHTELMIGWKENKVQMKWIVLVQKNGNDICKIEMESIGPHDWPRPTVKVISASALPNEAFNLGQDWPVS